MKLTMNVRTKRGAIRRANAILAQCRRDMRGGLSFGMDWPTLGATYPERYNELMRLKAIFPKLPD